MSKLKETVMWNLLLILAEVSEFTPSLTLPFDGGELERG
jgi:hypothetical protein